MQQDIEENFEAALNNFPIDIYSTEKVKIGGLKQDTRIFKVDPKSPSTNRLSLGGRGVASIHVPSTTLDDFCHTRNLDRVDLVKVDVEGAEPLVLRGARQKLKERAISALLEKYVRPISVQWECVCRISLMTSCRMATRSTV